MSKTYFSAIYLIFDFDPHYQKYSDKTILNILNFFSNETENGKLYINYPMVEAFYHLSSLPDYTYNNKRIPYPFLSGKEYKRLVNKEMAFAKNKLTDSILELIVFQNYLKAQFITNNFIGEINHKLLLLIQIEMKNTNNEIYVISTFPLIIVDYNIDILRKIKLNVEINYSFKIDDFIDN